MIELAARARWLPVLSLEFACGRKGDSASSSDDAPPDDEDPEEYAESV